MLEDIIQGDKNLLIFLNNLGNEQWDPFWLAITNQLHWIPLFVFILYLIFKKFGWKNGLMMMLFLIGIVAFSDQFTNFNKNYFQRLRPCNTESIVVNLRSFLYKPRGYSFYSGHASVSTTFTVFIIFLLKKHYKYIVFLLIFPLIFGYSRIYLGVHYPIDVFTGYLVGTFSGILFYVLQKKLKLTFMFS